VFSSQSLPPPGSFRHPWSRRKVFQRWGEVDRLAVTVRPNRSRYQLLTPPPLYSLPTAMPLPPDWLRYRELALPDSCTAACPHAWVGCSAGSIEEAASSYPGRGSVPSAGCESTGLPTSIHQHPFNTQSHRVSHSAAAPLKWPVSILVSSCFCCLFTRGSMASLSA
jgi:hypothetical protein